MKLCNPCIRSDSVVFSLRRRKQWFMCSRLVLFEHAFSSVVYPNSFCVIRDAKASAYKRPRGFSFASQITFNRRQMRGWRPPRVPLLTHQKSRKSCRDMRQCPRITPTIQTWSALTLRLPNATEKRICRDYTNLFLRVISFSP